MNIKLAIIDRIISGAASQSLFGTLKGKLDSISEKFKSPGLTNLDLTNLDLTNLSLENADALAKELSFSETSDGKK